MGREVVMAAMNVFFFTLLLSFSSCKASLDDTSSLHKRNLSISHHNPFSPKASLIRYWNKHVSNSLPKPQFLFSKSSPLSAIDSAIFTKLAAENSLSLHLDSFCSLAKLVCSFDPKQSSGNHGQHSNFALFSDKRFSNYGESRLSGVDSFKNYSNGLNSIADSFIRYSRDSTGHSTFQNYDNRVNVPGLRFTTYSSDGNNHKLSFSSYSDETNVGYGELGNGANDSFTVYGNSGNNPHNNFKNYGTNANSAIDSFSSYRNGANVGQDSFQTYAKNSKSGKVGFTTYGKTFNLGNDSFRDYGKGSKGKTNIGFKSYSLGRSFKVYNDKGVTFAGYSNTSSFPGDSGVSASKRWVEPGKFFRESMLKQGNVMVMPDMMDKMPKRSFLPLSIVSKLPFSTTSLAELKQVFQASDNSTMERVLLNALAECERVPSRGETKRCVGSVEGMVDFAVSVLGHDVMVKTTRSVNGSKKEVMIGSVKGINGGEVTKSVSCHQSLYPYLLYYCHSVPEVRVYEADIVDVESKEKINRGVAICHLDTSAWSPDHGAFVALGSSPGKIEVCHWIFENDMTWTIADSV
ncbi:POLYGALACTURONASE-1 NON-CATALYTIC SUBUNIT BETA [Salix viminalis]|uniref:POLYGALACTURONASE-1 NON-CATALYTIC SUBUNIT BETA n=1 Tax=Salix viminalis TaxID=40686 RepID=A0A9Q0NVK4_SALVM|nr:POLYGALACTURONASE-1 NON-CATALYTIC SUBUNIT BETA [Salix viminalis]